MMITLHKSGPYKLVETRRGTKLLHLDDKDYAWIEPRSLRSILVQTQNPQQVYETLSIGTYRLYSVVDEPDLIDEPHLELEVGYDAWQGYLLPTGLPTTDRTRRRIIPTAQIITHNPAYRERAQKIHTDTFSNDLP